MRPEFSEFSYGFAFTDAFVRRRGRLTTAPVFPSLRDERHKGWDVRLNLPGVSFFLQFKLSDRLTRPNATYWQVHGGSYFRIDITPLSRSPQHNLLKNFNDRGEDNVYYVAPFFYRMSQFDDAYVSNNIYERSLLIPVNRLPRLNDYEAHHLTFASTNEFRWHTDEENLHGETIEGDFAARHLDAHIQDLFAQGSVEPVSQRYFTNLRGRLEEILNSTRGISFRPFEDLGAVSLDTDDPLEEPMSAIKYYLKTYFGLEMFMTYQEPETL